MEATARPTTILQTLADIQTIFTKKFPESQIRDFVEKIRDESERSDKKAQVILKQPLHDVLTDLENLDAELSRKASGSFFIRVKSSGERTNLTQKMNKVVEDLERIAHMAKYLNKERKEFVGKSEKALEVVGREKEKEEIIDQLIYSSRIGSPVPVITIVGLAGIGKTKLAQLVCDDDKVKQQVGLPAWVSVTGHNTFDADTIAKRVTDISPSRTENPNIFVILDDLKIEIEDKDLQALQNKLNKARLYVTATTRSCLVVRNIAASPVKSYALAGLNEEESLSLFQTILE